MLDDRGTNERLPQADYVRHEYAADIFDDLNRLANRDLLKIGELLENLIVPRHFLLDIIGEPIFYEGVKSLEIDVIGSHVRQRPAFLQLCMKRRREVLTLFPKRVEPPNHQSAFVFSANEYMQLVSLKRSWQCDIACTHNG